MASSGSQEPKQRVSRTRLASQLLLRLQWLLRHCAMMCCRRTFRGLSVTTVSQWYQRQLEQEDQVRSTPRSVVELIWPSQFISRKNALQIHHCSLLEIFSVTQIMRTASQVLHGVIL